MSNSPTRTGGISLCGALFILFLALRLTDHIDWAWIWIAAPLWMPVATVLALMVVLAVVGYPIAALLDWRAARRNKRVNAEWRAKHRSGR